MFTAISPVSMAQGAFPTLPVLGTPLRLGWTSGPRNTQQKPELASVSNWREPQASSDSCRASADGFIDWTAAGPPCQATFKTEGPRRRRKEQGGHADRADPSD